MPITAEEPPKLQVGALVRQSYAFLGHNFGDFLRVAASPFLLSCAAHWFAAFFPDSIPIVVTAILLAYVFLSVFAIAWQRFLLLGAKTMKRRLGLNFGRREWNFLVYSLPVTVFPLVFSFALAILMDEFVGADVFAQDDTSRFFIAYFLPSLALGWLMLLRFSLVLPAVAVDRWGRWREQFAESWHRTARCASALFVAVILAELPVIALSFLYSWSFGTEVSGHLEFVVTIFGVILDLISIGLLVTILAITFSVRSGSLPSKAGTIPYLPREEGT